MSTYINNPAPQTLPIESMEVGYTKALLKYGLSVDNDVDSVVFWTKNITDSGIEQKTVNTYDINHRTFLIESLEVGKEYALSGAFLDKFANSNQALVDSKNPEILSLYNVPNYTTKTPASISNIDISGSDLGQIGAPTNNLNITIAGEATDFLVEILPAEGLVGEDPSLYDWSSSIAIYKGSVSPDEVIGLSSPSYAFVVRSTATYTFVNGSKDTAPSTYNGTAGSPIEPSNTTSDPSDPTALTTKAIKVTGNVESYNLKMNWDWVAEEGSGARRNALVSYKVLGTNDEFTETALSNEYTFVGVPYRKALQVTVVIKGWNENESSVLSKLVYISSDPSESGVVGYTVPVPDTSLPVNTNVQISPEGIKGFSNWDGTSGDTTFSFDASSGNVVVGSTSQYGGVAPLTFDAVSGILSIKGQTITDSIVAADYVMGWLGGEAPSFRTANRSAVGGYSQSTSGIWMGYENSSTFKFSMGDGVSNITWDGNILRISSGVVIGDSGSRTIDQTQKYVQVYKRQTSNAIAPIDGTYVDPIPTGWSKTIPAYNGKPCWTTSRTFTSDGEAPQDSWDTPSIISEAVDSAKLVTLTADSNVFVVNSDGVYDRSSVTITANVQNISSPAFQWTSTGGGGTPSGNTYTISSQDFGLSKSINVSVLVPTVYGDVTDTITVIRVQDGNDGTSTLIGYLTNEAHTIAANSDGSISSYAGASGAMVVYYGDTLLTSGSYSIGSKTAGLSINLSPTTGAYAVTGLTSVDATAEIIYTHPTYGTVSKIFSVSKSERGNDGDDGVSYQGTQEYYKLTNSSSAPSNGGVSGTGWSTTPLNPTSSNKYLWNYNVNSKTDGSKDTSLVSLITQYVKDGRGISTITETYQRGTSPTTAPTGTWRPTIAGAGALTASLPYMWNKTVTNFTDGSPSHTTTTVIAVRGDDGDAGQTTYTWIKYANNVTGGGLSNSPTGKEYIGFAYNKTTPTESTVPTDYIWSKIKGEDGVPGTPGEDGETLYTWIAYSDSPNGSGMYQTPNSNTKYIGISVNNTTATESSIPTDYVWSLFKGDDGVPGTDGTDGTDGSRGAGTFSTGYSGTWSSTWNNTLAAAAAAATTGGVPVLDDVVTVYNLNNQSLPPHIRRYTGGAYGSASSWTSFNLVVHGDALVEGTLRGDRLIAGAEIFAPKISGGSLFIGQSNNDYKIELDSGATSSPLRVFGKVGTDGKRPLMLGWNSADNFVFQGSLASGKIDNMSVFTQEIRDIIAPTVAGSLGGSVTAPAVSTTGGTTITSVTPTMVVNTKNVSVSFGLDGGYTSSSTNRQCVRNISVYRSKNGSSWTLIDSGTHVTTSRTEAGQGFYSVYFSFQGFTIDDSSHGAVDGDTLKYKVIATQSASSTITLSYEIKDFVAVQELTGGGIEGHATSASFPYIGLDTSGDATYPRLVTINNPGISSDWLRVPSVTGGILPYSNGNSSIGTSSWKFNKIHALNFYENGVLLSSKYLGKTAKAVDAGKLDGYSSAQGSVGDSVAVRDGSGDINARLFRSEYDGTNPTVNYIMTQIDTSSNNYIRPSTPVQFRAGVTDAYYLGKTAKAADSDKLGGLHLSSTAVNNEANRVVRTSGSGYVNFGWINTLSGIATGSLSRIYCSQDGFLRYLDMPDFAAAMSGHLVTSGRVLTDVPAGAVFTDTNTWRPTSSSVTSTSTTTSANSQAAKTAYDRGTAALNAANGKLSTTGTAANSSKLVGVPGAHFVYGENPAGVKHIGSTAELDGYIPSGFIEGLNIIPGVSGWVWGMNACHSNTSATGSVYGSQVLITNSGTSDMYFRNKNATGDGEFRKVWHNHNDGSGSGLDADLLDGQHASSFAKASHNHVGWDVRVLGWRLSVDSDGKIRNNNTDYRRAGMYGFYEASKTSHIWSMGSAYTIPNNGSNFGNLYGLAYKHTNNPTGGAMGGGHQMVWCQNGVPKFSAGDNVWIAGEVISNGYIRANGGLMQGSNVILNGSDTWLRTAGNTGWVSATYGGGIYMTDSTYVRVYASKALRVDSGSSQAVYIPSGGVRAGRGYLINNTGGSWVSQKTSELVGIYGTASVSSGQYAASVRQVHSNYTYTLGGLGGSYYGFHAFLGSSSSNAPSGYFRMGGTGDCTASGTIRASDHIATSDIRVKENILLIGNALSKVCSLTGNTYNRTDMENQKSAGIIAQEVEKVLPECVKENEEGLKQVSYNGVTALLVEAVKDLKSENDMLKARLEAIEELLNR